MIFHTKVVGVKFEDRQRLIRRLDRMEELEPDTELVLKREPENPYDSFAVAVLTSDDQQLGYLSKDCARQVSINMANGMTYKAYVSAVTGGDADNFYGINIRIEYN